MPEPEEHYSVGNFEPFDQSDFNFTQFHSIIYQESVNSNTPSQIMAGRLPSLTTRLSQLSISSRPPVSQSSTLTSLLGSPFHQPCRRASILSSLSDTPGSYNKRIRRGRGPASGKGKTSGRGHKGQKQHGKVPYGFNGGQTPESIVHGTRGFTN